MRLQAQSLAVQMVHDGSPLEELDCFFDFTQYRDSETFDICCPLSGGENRQHFSMQSRGWRRVQGAYDKPSHVRRGRSDLQVAA